MTYEESLTYIHSRKRFCGEPTLERMAELMCRMGDPQKKLKFVHIAGTNGKGSTTAMTANVLRHAGYKTGQYISPFVLCFRERMQIDGEMILEEELAQITAQVKLHCDAMENETCGYAPTEFEVVTAIALEWFARRGCDIVCLEVGLGGRFDATNVIDPPLVQVIMSISLDHTAILGDTVSQIAFEKCGIIKGGVTVCYPLQEIDTLSTIMEQCAQKGSTLIQPNVNSITMRSEALFRTCFCYGDLEITPSLAGEHQVYNAVTVVEICRQLRAQGFGIKDSDIVQGIASTRFPARMELLSDKPLIVLDGAHNPSGAQVLERVLEQLGEHKITVMMGMLTDKDWKHSAACIARHAARFIAVTPQSARALPAAELAETAKIHCADVQSYESIPQALHLAVENLCADDVLVVCGSLYLAAQVRPQLLEYTVQSRKATE
ncbi:folylpolyglutamate synthase/dihydrofolate synthase family protein [Hydrogenoanaerobacterium sp.]|uniref:bifunctional folylpolyglutamate synthase/dihydrofolate synthase n=1 Tax=Hydrogenoanaerobacterium sp. TaxID=2953763 RepID=UPI00289C0AE0|nr:folylpolyglutamate synthase/dihydrofolate synthase family protein [Hydrogenoanaerobacterium sp.]